MLTVLESLRLAAEYLQSKGIESPRSNAEIMLAHILKCKKLQLYLSFDRPLAVDETKLFREYLKRRSVFEPLQYILGSVEFYGLEFKVNPYVLIPRPETEILVETVIEAAKTIDCPKILDIGTGSGNIAVSIAKNVINSRITAIDASETALQIAAENSKLNSVDRNIIFKKEDIINDNWTGAEKFDIVVSNPPYIPDKEYETLAPELRLYEPRSALTDFTDGYKFYNIITQKAASLLNRPGRLFFEVGKDQYSKVMDIMTDLNFTNLSVIKDYQRIERVVSGQFE